MNYIFDHGGMTPADPIPMGMPELALPPLDPNNPEHWRKSAAQMIEWMMDRQFELITAMDLLDGDPDLEPSLGYSGFGSGDDREGGDVQDEPHDEIDEDGRDVAWPEGRPHMVSGAGNSTEDDEDDGTAEPSLGAPEVAISAAAISMGRSRGALWSPAKPLGSQENWARGRGDDDENAEAEDAAGGDVLDEPHDAMNDCDEPDLGWTEETNQANVHRFGSLVAWDLEASYLSTNSDGQTVARVDDDEDDERFVGRVGRRLKARINARRRVRPDTLPTLYVVRP
jgi:hypothetical protein